MTLIMYKYNSHEFTRISWFSGSYWNQILNNLLLTTPNQVSSMIRKKHGSDYLIINLSGRKYNYSKFEDKVLDYEWEDHHSPPINTLFLICQKIHLFLKCMPKSIKKNKRNLSWTIIRKWTINTFVVFIKSEDRKCSDNTLSSRQRKNWYDYLLLHDVFRAIQDTIRSVDVLWQKKVFFNESVWIML